jgi:hypothetical protein
MSVEDKIIIRIHDLIGTGNHLRSGNSIGQQLNNQHGEQCSAWMASAENIVQIVCPNPDNAYRKRVNEITRPSGLMIPSRVGEFTDLLNYLLVDIEQGLLSSVVNQVRAEAFDDFLDHAEFYYKDNRKNEAGVIAGVVFEDTIRKLCDKNTISQKGIKLDELISSLTKIDVITPTKAKRARVAAHVRTKATHAQWDEFDLEDVKATIDFTRELISNKLDS